METPDLKEAFISLAKACARHLTLSAFEDAWNAATSQRPESIGVGADSVEQMRLRLEFLYKEYALLKFIATLVERRPPPERPVRDAVSALLCGMTIDTASWEHLNDGEKEEIFVDRDAFMKQGDLSNFCHEVWPRMCCLVGKVERLERNGVRMDVPIGGSGFLVGPDMIMTSSHVIESLLNSDGAEEPDSYNKFRVFFDHYRAQQIDDHTGDYQGVLKVAPHIKWLVARSPPSRQGANDGEIDQQLDYALIRLSCKVGYAARNRRGGSARGWVKVPLAHALQIGSDSRVAIPQHPERSGLVLDVGRVAGGLRYTTSRVTYYVNTRYGSSGSPVLATGGTLAALHEGKEPGGKGFRNPWNQGIRVEAFNSAIAQYLPGPEDNWCDHVDMWCVGGNRQEPLIGRREFIEWIEKSRGAQGEQEKANWPPICVITGGKNTGKSFSAKILTSLVVSHGDDVIVFRSLKEDSPGGLDGAYELPQRPEGVVRALSERLAFRTDEPMPPAPPDPEQVETALGITEAKDNKPNNWASTDLPDWLEKRLKEQFDGRPEGRLWVVFDFGPNATLRPFMQGFLDRWTTPVAAEHPFSMCRFVFIDFDPAFRTIREKWPIVPSEAKLRPVTDIGEVDVKRFLDAAHAAAGLDVGRGMLEALVSILHLCADNEERFWENLSRSCRHIVRGIFMHEEEH
jgi:Trypsin-like peptidase domain